VFRRSGVRRARCESVRGAHGHSNVPHGRVAHLRQDPTKTYSLLQYSVMSQQRNNLPASKEARLQLALQAIQCDATLSQKRAATIYNVSRKTLGRKRTGTPLRSDCTPNSMILLKTEEDVIVQYIHDLVVRGNPPRLAAVKDMAGSLLAERHRNAELQAANEASSKRRSRKRKRVQQKGP
jgi:hypothetical protein